MSTLIANGNEVRSPKQVIIAMAQIVCLDGDRAGNFVRIENAIKVATTRRADIVCFPEMAILGWTNPAAHRRAFAIPGEDTDRLCELARRHHVFVCIGLAETKDGQLFDAAVLIDDQGAILLKHRKHNILTELMTPPYTPGQEIQAVDTRFGKIGILICADTFDNVVLDKMKCQMPDYVLVPYGWANREEAWPDHAKSLENTVASAAKTLACPVVGTNLVGRISNGPWSGMVYGGQSVACDADGTVVAKAVDRDVEVRVFAVQR